MKVTTSTPEKEFEPIVLTITIESKEELAEMYARHNCNNSKIKDSAFPSLPIDSLHNTGTLFMVLDDIAESRFK